MPKLAKSQSINLSPEVLTSWKEAIVKMTKLKGSHAPRRDFTTDELVTAVMKQESRGAFELWEIFTKQRGQLAKGLLSGKPETISYVVGFHLANVARAELLFKRANDRYRLKEYFQNIKKPVIWHDLGCGSGAVTQAAHDVLLRLVDTKKLVCHLYDITGSLLDAAKLLLQGLPLRTHKIALELLDIAKFQRHKDEDASHWFSLGYVWNELAKNPAARSKILKLFEGFKDVEAGIVLLEPATQDISRNAMELRDQLCAMGYIPIYPCPSALPCPMLDLKRDWCYTEGYWQRPNVMVRLDQYMKIDRSQISGTMMFFVSPALHAKLAERKATTEVVVGRPLRKERSKAISFDYLICRKSAGELELGKIPGKGEETVSRGQSLPTATPPPSTKPS